MKRETIISPVSEMPKSNPYPRLPDVFLCDGHSFRSTKTRLDLCASARLYALAAHVGTPAGLGLRCMGLGAIGGQADVIEIDPHLCERFLGPEEIPPAAADPQRPLAGHGLGLPWPAAHHGQRVRRPEPHDPRERPE